MYDSVDDVVEAFEHSLPAAAGRLRDDLARLPKNRLRAIYTAGPRVGFLPSQPTRQQLAALIVDSARTKLDIRHRRQQIEQGRADARRRLAEAGVGHDQLGPALEELEEIVRGYLVKEMEIEAFRMQAYRPERLDG